MFIVLIEKNLGVGAPIFQIQQKADDETF